MQAESAKKAIRLLIHFTLSSSPRPYHDNEVLPHDNLVPLARLADNELMRDNPCSSDIYPKLKCLTFIVNFINERAVHTHEEIEIIGVMKGSGTLWVDKKKVEMKETGLYILNSHVPHSIESKGGPIQTLIAQISPSYADNFFPQFKSVFFEETDLSSKGEKIKNALWTKMLALAHSYFFDEQLKRFKTSMLLSDFVYLILSSFPYRLEDASGYGLRKESAAGISAVIDYIKANYKQKIKMGDVASLIYVTPTHFSHWFHKNFGMPFQSYLELVRYETAVAALDNPATTIKEAFLESGFSDPKYMVSVFRKRLGVTPSEYRRQNLNRSGTYAAGPFSASEERILPLKECVSLIDDFTKQILQQN